MRDHRRRRPRFFRAFIPLVIAIFTAGPVLLADNAYAASSYTRSCTLKSGGRTFRTDVVWDHSGSISRVYSVGMPNPTGGGSVWYKAVTWYGKDGATPSPIEANTPGILAGGSLHTGPYSWWTTKGYNLFVRFDVYGSGPGSGYVGTCDVSDGY